MKTLHLHFVDSCRPQFMHPVLNDSKILISVCSHIIIDSKSISHGVQIKSLINLQINITIITVIYVYVLMYSCEAFSGC